MSKKMIMLKSSDGVSFTIEEAVALKSQTIKNLIEDDCAKTEIPIPNVTGKIMALVIEYCQKHVVDGESSSSISDEILKAWDVVFMKKNQSTIFGLIMAANFLNINSLLDLTCQTAADMIKGKTPVRYANSSTLRMILQLRKKKMFAGRINGFSSDQILNKVILFFSVFFFLFYSVS